MREKITAQYSNDNKKWSDTINIDDDTLPPKYRRAVLHSTAATGFSSLGPANFAFLWDNIPKEEKVIQLIPVDIDI